LIIRKIENTSKLTTLDEVKAELQRIKTGAVEGEAG
jgi:hypothetical protein